jgi:hypothetical protein
VVLPTLLIWVKLSFDFLKELRETLWILTCENARYLHLRGLQYNIYFYIAQWFYKFHFVLFDIFVGGTGATFIIREEASLLFKITSLLYYKSWIILLSCFFSIIVELILYHGKIYYGFTRVLAEDDGHKAMNSSATLALTYDKQIDKRREGLRLRIHGIKCTAIYTRKIMGQPRSLGIRIAGQYYYKKHVRWFSSSKVLHDRAMVIEFS